MTRKHSPPPAAPEVEPASTPETLPPHSPIAQIEMLYGTLRQALRQSRELLTSLKRQKKQSRLVESTLASLRELQSTSI